LAAGGLKLEYVKARRDVLLHCIGSTLDRELQVSVSSNFLASSLAKRSNKLGYFYPANLPSLGSVGEEIVKGPNFSYLEGTGSKIFARQNVPKYLLEGIFDYYCLVNAACPPSWTY
jgi:hypothetical protein